MAVEWVSLVRSGAFMWSPPIATILRVAPSCLEVDCKDDASPPVVSALAIG
jgi:hypothetical protein